MHIDAYQPESDFTNSDSFHSSSIQLESPEYSLITNSESSTVDMMMMMTIQLMTPVLTVTLQIIRFMSHQYQLYHHATRMTIYLSSLCLHVSPTKL